ncbi:nose resistant to fluoxetine protein 6-like isoform X2 [Daktulosphaira vitifoliae]|uniref:nose resistant to fluoxetine protein 6-like isoform X2 n=1 Tax=Daktulosphaira vitifoliae TaxID=58002 RepID=UPI0021AABC58|nr:nose resistant to fluoxetine protein 6-like isoform X2 [Daktulosphaira vitifoliae]
MVFYFLSLLLFVLSTNALLTLSPNIIPSLPNTILNSSNPKCQKDSIRLLENLKTSTLWAQQMWDASAKQAVGLLTGNIYQLGDFDECLQVTKPIQAQYCLIDIKINVPREYSLTDPNTRDYNPMLPSWHKIYYGGARFKQRLDIIKWALCVPQSCSSFEIQTYLQSYIKENNITSIENISVNDKMCTQTERAGDKYDAYDWTYLFVILVLLLLVTFATLFDFTAYSKQEIWQWNKENRKVDVLMCFSARRAIQSLTQRNYILRDIDFSPLSGITTISAVLIIVGHRWMYRLMGPLQNYEVNEQVYYNYYISIFTSHMDLLVDIFFVISGALLVLILLDRLETSFVHPLKIIIFKYFRFTPVYAMVIFFFATFQYKLGSGPLWENFIGTDKDNCRNVWWLYLLYLNNYIKPDTLCEIHTWFMPCEFHFTIMGIILTYIIHRSPKFGFNILVSLIVISTAILFNITYMNHIPANLEFNVDFVKNVTSNIYFMSVYVKSHTRVGPYIVGAIFGYLLYKRKKNSPKLSIMKSNVLQAISVFIMMFCWFSGAIIYHPSYVYEPFLAALYGSTIRSLWATGTATLIYTLILGSSNFLKNFFSWKVFKVVALLNFNAYMVNSIFPVSDIASRRTPDHFTIKTFITNSVSDVVMSYAASLFLYILVERPFKLLINQIFISKPKVIQNNKCQNNLNH